MKYCQHHDSNLPGYQTCEKIAVIEFRYRYASETCSCSDRYCPLTRNAREGCTPLCQRHYDEHKSDPPYPDNEIPVAEQWSKLPEYGEDRGQ